MSSQDYILGVIPERFVEVDSARLLLVLAEFATDVTDSDRRLKCFPRHDVLKHFAPEYYLHKLDFLLRYPSYFAYELTELFRMEIIPPERRSEVIAQIRTMLRDEEPLLKTLPFRKFWRGAYERLDDVEAWWYARSLVFTGTEPRGDGRPWKHYFLSPLALSECARLTQNVMHAQWYQRRIALIHVYFGSLSAAKVKTLQYSHPEYRAAQLSEEIPDLSIDQIEENFLRVFGEPIGEAN